MSVRINLGNLSLAQLHALKKRVEKQIQNHKDQNIKLAKIEAMKVVKKYGVSFNDIIDADSERMGARSPSKLKMRKIPAKYVSPNSSALTWTGRGRKPKWVEEALESGLSLSDLLI